jgi:hypothetical protein
MKKWKSSFLYKACHLKRRCTFLFAKNSTSLFAKNDTFLIAKKCTLLFAIYIDPIRMSHH